MRVYLDRQIVIDHFNGNANITEAVAKFHESGSVFPYSPAHIEEIAGAHHTGSGAPVSEQLAHLSRLSGNWALMPTDGASAAFRIEDINACFARVYDNGGKEETDFAIEVERSGIAQYTTPEANAELTRLRERLEAKNASEIFQSPEVFHLLEQLAREKNFRIKVATFGEREATIAVLFDVLNRVGFRKEHNDKRIGNRVHDVSHAIYASYTDVFVTNDRKLRHSVEAIFPFCNINVEILSMDQFVQRATLFKEQLD